MNVFPKVRRIGKIDRQRGESSLGNPLLVLKLWFYGKHCMSLPGCSNQLLPWKIRTEFITLCRSPIRGVSLHLVKCHEFSVFTSAAFPSLFPVQSDSHLPVQLCTLVPQGCWGRVLYLSNQHAVILPALHSVLWTTAMAIALDFLWEAIATTVWNTLFVLLFLFTPCFVAFDI